MKANPTKAHMASLATAAYILAADQKVAQAALVSVRNGTAFYKGEIVTRPDTGIKTLADIKGRTFARVDPLSASGWIIPSLMLKGAGIDLDKDIKVVDAGSHPGVVTAVYSGQADAGACFVDARAQVEKDKPDVMEKVVVIQESGNIPNDGVQFHPSVRPGAARRRSSTRSWPSSRRTRARRPSTTPTSGPRSRSTTTPSTTRSARCCRPPA